MAEKTGRNGDDERRSNFGLKLNVHVWYNMLTAIWPAPIAYLACKLRLTIYYNKAFQDQLFTHSSLRAGIWI